MKLPLKLAIFVLILFALVVTAMLLWKPVKVRYYTSKLQSDNIKVRQAYAKKLLEMGAREPVFRYYTDKYDPKSVEKRMAVVDELCEVGDKGKAVMKEIFRNWCYSPLQQVKIPAGTLTLDNGSKVEIKSLWVDKYETTMEKWWVYLAITGYRPPDIPTRRQKYHWPRVPENGDLPVGYVTGAEAKSYAELFGMRLLTEYEWEYAARSGSNTKFCFGDDESLLDEYVWHKNNADGKPHPVGQRKANNWNLYDMQGNVLEQVYYDESTVRVKGGCYSQPLWRVGTYIGWPWSGRGCDDTGFRCVRDVK
jgi:hypothetical protein